MRQARQTEATMSNAETGTREFQIVTEVLVLKMSEIADRLINCYVSIPKQIKSKQAASSVSYSFTYGAWS